MATKKLQKKPHMNMWSSVVSKRRAVALGNVVKRIEEHTSVINRQVGNITNDLKNYGEFGLIDELKEEIEAYNLEIDDWNKRIQYVQTVYNLLKRFRKNEFFDYAFSLTFCDGVFVSFEEFEGDAYRAKNVFEQYYSEARRYA